MSTEPLILEVAIAWRSSLLDVHHACADQPLSLSDIGLGSRRDATPFVSAGAQRWLFVPPRSHVTIIKDGVVTPIDELDNEDRLREIDGRSQFLLDASEVAALTTSGLSVRIRFVTKEQAARTAPAWSDALFAKVLVATAGVHALAAMMAGLDPGYSATRDDDLFRTASALVTREVRPAVHSAARKTAKSSSAPRGAPRAASLHRTLTPSSAAPKRGAVDARKRQDDVLLARRAGLLGMLNKGGRSRALAGVFDEGLGSDIAAGVAGIGPGSTAAGPGADGLQSRGIGVGGAYGAKDIVALGAFMPGPGTDVDIGSRGPHRAVVRSAPLRVQGALEKEEIARVIRRHMSRIRYCYERELLRNPNLAGKIVVGFTIGADGLVSETEIAESTLLDGTIEACVSSVVGKLAFPQPRGGGVVVVSHPFVFQSAGR